MNKTDIENVSIRAADLGRLFSLTAHRVRELAREGIIPAATKGKFPLAAAVAAYVKHLRTKSQASTLTAARRRKMEADAALAELKLEDQQNKILEAIVDDMAGWVTQARQLILSAEKLTDEEKNDLIETLGKLLDKHLDTPISPLRTTPEPHNEPTTKKEPPRPDRA